MDLSRNRLEGIEPLLRVPEAESLQEQANSNGIGSSQQRPGGRGEASIAGYTYPLAGLLELRLNGCVRSLYCVMVLLI